MCDQRFNINNVEKRTLFSSAGITKEGEKEGLEQIGDFDYWVLEETKH